MSAHQVKGQYHLYYTGVQKGLGGLMAIGHVTSGDGIHWTKNPVYFTSVGLSPGGSPPARRVIALAKSSHASRFGAPKIVLEQSDLYPARLGFDGYSAPSSVLHEGRVHLFCDVGYFDASAARKWTQVVLHHAVSDDGETNWKQDRAALFTRRSLGWTSLEIRSPTAVFEGDVLRLWFAGNALVEDFLPEVRKTGRTAKFGIGCATMRAAHLGSPGRAR